MKSPRDQEIVSWWGGGKVIFFTTRPQDYLVVGMGTGKFLFPQKFKLKEIHETK